MYIKCFYNKYYFSLATFKPETRSQSILSVTATTEEALSNRQSPPTARELIKTHINNKYG
jgi:hypothetical protein